METKFKLFQIRIECVHAGHVLPSRKHVPDRAEIECLGLGIGRAPDNRVMISCLTPLSWLTSDS